MIKSMTGFGTAKGTQSNWECMVELRSVNQRFLDVRVRIPNDFNALETQIKDQVRQKCSRGKVDCFINLSPLPGAAPAPKLNQSLAQAYSELLDDAETTLGRPIQVNLKDLLMIDGIIESEALQDSSEDCEPLVKEVVQMALEQLEQSRIREGKALLEDIETRFAQAAQHLDQIVTLVGDMPQQQYQRLTKNLEALGQNVATSDEAIQREVAIWADRCDVSEEITRFRAHLDHVKDLLQEPKEVGKKLEFLLQELQREVNTIASKSHSAEANQVVVSIKSELEKIREQAQNIE